MGWDEIRRFLAKANTWTGKQTFSDIAVTGGTFSGVTFAENFTTSADPAENAAVTTAIVDSYDGVVVTLSAAGNTQTIQNPTTAATIRKFMVINNDTSTHSIPFVANSVTFTLTPGEGQCFLWDGSAWGPTDLGITDIPVKVTQGGTGLATITDHGIILGSGTGAVTPLGVAADGQIPIGSTGADPVLATISAGDGLDVTNGAGAITIAADLKANGGLVIETTELAVDLGASAITGTLAVADGGTGASTASGAFSNIKQQATTLESGVTVYAGTTKALAGTDAASAMTPADVKNKVAVDVNPKAMSQGVAMTAAASGSNGIAVADNDNIDYRTGNFFGVISVLLADYTPSAEVVLEQKHDGTNGRKFTLQTNGKLRVTINTTNYDSTVATGCTDNTMHVFGYSVTRETAAAAGSIIFVVDGVQLGDAVAITAGAPTTINNAVSQYVSGTSATRTAGTVNGHVSGNRALTAAEHLALYRNGIAEADKWGSQMPFHTSDFSSDTNGYFQWNGTVTGNIDSIGGEDNWLRYYANATNGTHESYRDSVMSIGRKYRVTGKVYIQNAGGSTYLDRVRIHSSPSPAAAVTYAEITTVGSVQTFDFELTSVGVILFFSAGKGGAWSFVGANSATDDLFYIKDITVTPLGAVLTLEPEGIQPAPGQWLDSSSNKLHALQPATGSRLTRYKKDFELRWTNTWTASSAAQYVGGLNQAVMTADHFITDIITQATVTTDVENLTLGDGSDADRFVTAFAPSATRTKQTVAAQNDGTNLKLIYTPAAEATMTVETIIRGFIWEP